MNSTAAWIGLRYLRARQGSRFVGFISGIAMTGIALGVFTLIVVLSVMNGFERELSRRILDVVAHATLEGDAGRLDDWRGIAQRTGAEPGVVAVAPFVEGRGMVVAGERSSAVDLRAVEPDAERRVSALERWFGFELFDPAVYYISRIPSELRAADVALVSVTAFALTLLATLYPARQAAATEPAEALRYE